jgi:serine/threonine protein kinase/tetratricopeptide (TPR) repeat protein
MKEREIFDAALAIADPDERDAFLNQACNGDPGLKEHLRGLLEMEQRLGRFLEAPDSPPTMTIDPPRPAEGPGTIIGPYKLREQIGEGGMGVVYVAEQSQPVRRKVALKIIKPGMDTRQVIARFEAERQALAMMDHPNIAKVHDAGATESGRPYFVMELVRGIPITEYCDRERLSILERLELFVLVCRAVQHAHQKGIIHRDLKPSNILVTVIDGAAVPKIIDFGVAKATGASLTERTIYTAFHQFVGTPLYMSPEQADLAGMDVDTRSDIYSLGVLLYELLTGTTPFDQNTFRTAAFDEVRRIIREQEPPKPSTRLSSLGVTRATVSANRKADARHLDRAVRGELDWIVMKALEKDRRRRYETANDFASDVMRYLADQPVQAGPPSAGYRLRKFVRRNKGPVAAGLSLAVLLVLGTVGTSIGLVRALRAERRARTAEGLAKDRLLEVSKEKERATAAEAKAKAAAAAAEAVVNFLQDDLLAQADPGQNARDEKVTVEEVLGRAAARIAGKFAQQPLVEAKIRQTIGKTYRTLSHYSAARPHLERAWELYRANLGEEDLNSLNILDDLAGLYLDQGQPQAAEPLLAGVLKVRRRDQGDENPDTLVTMTNLAEAYRIQGRHSEAIELLEKTLTIGRRVLGEDDGRMLAAMNDLAVNYGFHRPEAEALLAKVVDVLRRKEGEGSYGALIAMNNLSEVYVARGEYLRAAELLEEMLKIRRRVWGEDHDLTLGEMNNLARVYWLAGRLDRSVPLFEEVVPKFLAHFGPDHPGTILAMANLGVNYRDAGRVPEGITKLEQAREWDRKRHGPRADPHDWLHITRELVDAYDRAGQFASSEPLYRETLEAERKHHAEASAEVAQALVNLGANRLNQRKYADAESLFRKALATFRKRHEEESPQAAGAMAWLGLDLLKQQKYAEAEPFVRECLKIRERIAPDNWMTFTTRSLLGGSLLGQKRYAEAEPMLRTGYEGMKQREATIPPGGRARLTEATERLVQLYEAWGKPEKAAVWKARLGPTDLPADVFGRP